MNWKQAIEWCRNHNASLEFQQIGQVDITVWWGTYYSVGGDYMEVPKLCEMLDQAIHQKKEVEGVRIGDDIFR